MKFKIFDKESLNVAIIACGDTGQSIGGGIIRKLKNSKVKVKSFAITSKREDHSFAELFDTTISIDDSKDGFAKKFDDATKSVQEHGELIDELLRKLLGKSFNGLVFITTGPGATGLATTLEIAKRLISSHKIYPPILTLLPEIFENSRVQYNTAHFLYEVAFKPNATRNPLIILDNKPSLDEMEMYFSEVSEKRIETIPTAIADLIIASFAKSISDEFDANMQDLIDVMHTQGISVFVAEDLASEEKGLDSSRIEDVISDSVVNTTSLSKDRIFEARNAFVSIFNIDEIDRSLDFETRKLFREFGETTPFVKFIAADKKRSGELPKLRAIIAGLPIPTRILQIMRIAQESRKHVIIEERRLEHEMLSLEIDKISKLEEESSAIFGKIFPESRITKFETEPTIES